MTFLRTAERIDSLQGIISTLSDDGLRLRNLLENRKNATIVVMIQADGLRAADRRQKAEPLCLVNKRTE